MKHTDFYMMYKAIRDKEVVALKMPCRNFLIINMTGMKTTSHVHELWRVRNIVIIQVIMRCVGLQKILAMIVAFLLKIWKAEKL